MLDQVHASVTNASSSTLCRTRVLRWACMPRTHSVTVNLHATCILGGIRSLQGDPGGSSSRGGVFALLSVRRHASFSHSTWKLRSYGPQVAALFPGTSRSCLPSFGHRCWRTCGSRRKSGGIPCLLFACGAYFLRSGSIGRRES